jgi:hypothetical protein
MQTLLHSKLRRLTLWQPTAKGGDKESKLTATKKRILQACSGIMHADEFVVEQVYQDMDAEGGHRMH